MAFITGWLGIGAAAAGNPLAEPTDTAYARPAVSLSDLNPFQPSYAQGPLCFGQPSASWGALTCAGIFDAATGGNPLLYWTIEGNHAAPAGTTFSDDCGLGFGWGIVVDRLAEILADGRAAYLPGFTVGRIARWNRPVICGSAFTYTA